MSSAKNELQEFFQKKNLPLPQYNTIIHSPEPYLRWKSVVTIAKIPHCLKIFGGSPCKSKVDAEISAANVALEYINNTIPDLLSQISVPNTLSSANNYIPLIPVPRKSVYASSFISPQAGTKNNINSLLHDETVLLIDVENIPKIIDNILSKYSYLPSNLKIYAFVGKYTPQASVVEKIKDNKITIIFSPSTRKDGTDTYIQMFVGKLLSEELYKHYIICTRDHFGGTLVEFIQSNDINLWKPQKATLVSTIEHIDETLNKIGYI